MGRSEDSTAHITGNVNILQRKGDKRKQCWVTSWHDLGCPHVLGGRNNGKINVTICHFIAMSPSHEDLIHHGQIGGP